MSRWVRNYSPVRLGAPNCGRGVIAITPRSEIESLMSLAGQGSDLNRKHKVYLQLVGVATVPDSYEERLTEIFPGGFKHLRLLALDPYDLALSKLERNAQRDRDDVKHLGRTVPLDLDVLQERYQQELRPDLGNPEREDLTLKLWIEVIKKNARLSEIANEVRLARR
ncbi:MAG: hypothetical protein QOJ64_4568 [Acidobacteriota bacterium]|nr:hypothetical protein [Acidobacteriota bacterium]